MEKNFEEFGLSEKIVKSLNENGYIVPSAIQEQAIPKLLEGKDLIGQSQTGTGKTASFGIPLIEKIDANENCVQALVLCPTRELAVQVAEEMRKFTKYIENMKILAIYGGQDITRQIQNLKRGVKIVVGTPGRVMDHMRRKTLKLDNVKIVVLDEADEMLNMGFEEDIETILKDIPENRQTVLFSATMNSRIMNITKKYLKEPENIKIKAKELTVEKIKQVMINLKNSMKDEALMRILDVERPKKAIIFCNTKKKVDDLIEILRTSGYDAEGLHGDIKQIQRDRIMKSLKSGTVNVLVATDIAARGIDVDELELVINYDVPQEDEYYVHRIGRTGRNGSLGKAYTFVVGRERSKIYDIERYAKTKLTIGKIPSVEEVIEARNENIIKNIEKSIKNKDENLKYSAIIKRILDKNYNIEEVAEAILSMHLGSSFNRKIEDIENLSIISDKKYENDRNGNGKNGNRNRNREKNREFFNGRNNKTNGKSRGNSRNSNDNPKSKINEKNRNYNKNKAQIKNKNLKEM